ncbi:SusC/RagA family TonB-linked outer membrane protein [Algoriphagus sp. NG3]|uniref:SusC/RagA family TonB-linked outer membrane protein n=1 Tax=Algoriphagus sp. NG3 TaxID=3097546 RepID=UPI002A7F28BD|nr:SusC/RagA family TonB-linked outer membrane protein [Algoriphagus sp. NG3]WPR73743.1 SusC/RagA family TonB-linked outer membrane protein [Algoriphagus sp. NG3]
MKKIFILLIGAIWANLLFAQNTSYRLIGKVISKSDNIPLPGAMVTLGEGSKIGIADESGTFELESAAGQYVLRVTYLGMAPVEIEVRLPQSEEITILMDPEVQALHEVTVMSTGYQNLPAERVTGSFVAVDRELVNRRVSTNLIDRLEDVTPGLIFNRGPNTGRNQISIRGRSTLFANASPLIILDNFPYDGPLESINPNDIEQITVLKDAAAASIWGARAGNGVIVITTKSGNVATPTQVSFNSNVNLFQERDMFYASQMNMGDFVDIQKSLFESNFYRSQEISPNRTTLPLVVETLIAERDGLITPQESNETLDMYRNQDLRRELQRYYYRPRLNQQYSLAVTGGGTSNTYTVSLGYDKNLQEVYWNEDDRWTLQAKNSWKFLNNKLNWTVGLYMSKAKGITGTSVPQNDPYTRLADDLGNPLPVYTNLSRRYVNSVAGLGLLDWNNVPLNEIGMLDYKSDRLDGRFQTGLSYQILPGFQAEVSYQYWTNRGRNRELNPESLYYVRDLVNQYTQIDDNGILSRPIPTGAILDLDESDSYSHTVRSVLSYRKKIGADHQVNLIVGTEIRDLQGESNSIRFFGYNDQLATSRVMDYLTRFPYQFNPSRSFSIDPRQAHSGFTDRFVSFYGNGGYTYKNKLDFTASIRKDQSNFFGVDANNRGVPLWSAGLGWTISQEKFSSFLGGAYLKLKASYGFSGNLDKNLSADMTASYFNFPASSFIANIPGANISNPPNPGLTWEKVRIWNSGMDFESKGGKFRGSLEFFRKTGIDLIGQYEPSISSGFLRVTSNYASTETRGLDLVLGGDWLTGALGWQTDLFYSRVSDEVKIVDLEYDASALIGSFSNANPIPVEGNPLFSVYSYPWGGLNADTGNPIGFLDGETSENYSAILSGSTLENIQFHGSSRPTDFGALRNTFSYRGFSLSVNVSYRFGYYYRRPSIDYFSLLRGQIGHGDFEKRWLEPGDELVTQVPSLPETAITTRHLFYTNSAVLVERGDHIRLQDIRFSYSLDQSIISWLPFKRTELYAYANNLGIIWKASSDPLDPDFQNARPLKSLAFGLKLDF